MFDLTLYLVTDHHDLTDDQFFKNITTACNNGVTLVQLREKNLTTDQFYQLAKKVKIITDIYKIPLIINDRVDICLAVDAAGVHIGDDELPVSVTRRLIGKKILGVSAKTVVRGLEAQQEGADYLGVGAIFPTQTKKTPLTSMETLKKMITAIDLPIVAIGGIKENNLKDFAGTGIDGIAVVSEIMQAEDVQMKVQNLRRKVGALIDKRD